MNKYGSREFILCLLTVVVTVLNSVLRWEIDNGVLVALFGATGIYTGARTLQKVKGK